MEFSRDRRVLVLLDGLDPSELLLEPVVRRLRGASEVTAEAWVAILAVACVGLLLIAVVVLTGWKRAQDLLDEVICDREFVWGIAFETAEQRDDAREDAA